MFRAIALGGGGARGGLHLGALAAIENRFGNLEFPDGIYGCSVGSLIATGIAFGLNAKQLKTMYDAHFAVSAVFPNLRLNTITQSFIKKGLFTMDKFEETLLRAFDSENIDLRGKTINDTKQKLYIVASNLTTKKLTFFTGDVPIIEAIKCSSCLPLVFHPQILYNNVYVDGGVFVDSFHEHVSNDTLILYISSDAENLYPKTIELIGISEFLHSLYRNMRTVKMADNMVWLKNDTVSVLQELTDKDRIRMFSDGYLQTFAFLAKRFPQERLN